MAVIQIPEIITVSEVRKRIGNPTSNPTEAGGISDIEIRDIINDHEKRAKAVFESRIIQNDFNNLPDHVFQPIEISVNTGGDSPRLAQGSVDTDEYYPIAKTAIDASNGEELNYDPQIHLTAKMQTNFPSLKSGNEVEQKRFMVDDGNVYVLPNDVDTVEVWLPDLNLLFDVLMGDQIAEINDRIVEEARRMLQSKVQEGTRLEVENQDIDSND